MQTSTHKDARAKVAGRISFSGQELPVGLDIGHNQIRAAQLKRHNGELVLHDFGSISIPKDATDEGEIIDTAAITEALKTFWRERKFTGKVVATGVANQQIIFRMIDFPWTEEKDLREAVLLQAQEFIPIPVEDAIIDFAITGEKVNDKGERVYELMLSAVERNIIDKVVSSIQDAGLKLARIDLTPLALVRSVLGDNEAPINYDGFFGETETVAVLHIASGTTNLAIVEAGVPRFIRFLPTGGDMFTTMLARELDIPLDEAEKIKRDLGLPALDGSVPALMDYDAELVFKAQSVLEREVSRYINELRLSLEFYISNSASGAEITKIFATGSGMRLINLPAYLEASLKADIQIADPFASISVSDTQQRYLGTERYSYAPAIGLAIGGR
ncbi:MAG: type IV pilus assembly protein PilM [Coriobacteriia bacterium]|nr:type IV pilus assembly protein PilM [Coriobacteriia bacterium]